MGRRLFPTGMHSARVAEVTAINEAKDITLSSLSVRELKRLLSERGIDFWDCLEKRDLVHRLQKTPSTFVTPVDNGNDDLTEGESRLIQTFKRVSPSVACIKSSGKQGRGSSLGSGFLWDSCGHVVTNYHVVSVTGNPGGVVRVKLQGMARARDAIVVGWEQKEDIAVLKLKDTSNLDLPEPIDVGTSNDLQVGQSVYAIGNPFGLDGTLTQGIISALGRDVPGVGGRPIRDCLQTDAAINPGNSGGPLLDSRGRLIGVNTTRIYSRSRESNGFGFAIPVDTVRRVVNQIIACYGKAALGIQTADDRIKRVVEEVLGLTLDGVMVGAVISGSPAAIAGLQGFQTHPDGSIVVLGDLITHINGQPVSNTEDLLAAIEERQDGETVNVCVWCYGAHNIDVCLKTRDKLHQGHTFMRALVMGRAV